MKRTDYISWDEYFMGISLLSGMRSKDPSTQVGACIVDSDNRIVSIGYNGFLNGCSDEDFPWEREGDFLNTKYPYVVHAEQNAMLSAARKDMIGATMYLAGEELDGSELWNIWGKIENPKPCPICKRMIQNAGIGSVITGKGIIFERGLKNGWL